MNFKREIFTAVFILGFVLAASSGPAVAQELSDGAKQVLDKAMADQSAARDACRDGRDGVTQYIRQVITEMMQSGASLSPSSDGPAAGEAMGRQCRSLLGG